MKIVTIIGARPQFIKASAVSRIIRENYPGIIEEVVVHTGQHYDRNMSQVFFNELGIPDPDYNLNICGGQHGEMTGRMIESIETVLTEENPDCLLTYGDTNSTLAGAIAAVKLHIPIAHVEAGLRSFNNRMPEEINRVLVDRISTLLFCPTETAVDNLKSEGIRSGVYNVGDVMFDAALFYAEHARNSSTILNKLNLEPGNFTLATCHRAENTDDRKRLLEILSGFRNIARHMPVVLPLHPRTRKMILQYNLSDYLESLEVSDPLSYVDMLALEQSAMCILTDSGGIQKEAFFYNTPCITLRDETEWVETVDAGCNVLIGADSESIFTEWKDIGTKTIYQTSMPYGSGNASKEIIDKITSLI